MGIHAKVAVLTALYADIHTYGMDICTPYNGPILLVVAYVRTYILLYI